MEKNHRRLACNLSYRRKTVQKFYKKAGERGWRELGENLGGSFCAIQVDIEPSLAIIKYMKEFMLIPFLEPKWIERGYI